MKIRVSFAGPYQDLMTEAPRRLKSSHFGVILEASKRLPGGLQEAPRRLLGGSQKGPRCPDAAPEGPHVRPWLGETPRGCSGCGSALSVGVLALLALLALAFEPNQCKNLSSVSLSGPWQVSLPLLLRLSERAKRASEGITWPTRYLLML